MAKLPIPKKNSVTENPVTEVDEVVVSTGAEEFEVPEVTAEKQENALENIVASAEGAAEKAEQEGSSDSDEEITSTDPFSDGSSDPEEVEGKKKDEDNDFITPSIPEVVVPTKETRVKVATTCNHSCHIGGEAYHFVAGVTTYVPRPVKDILKRAGLLAAI